MSSLPKGPGGEVRSPARLGRDTATLVLNALRRNRNNAQTDERPVHRPGVIAEGRFIPSGALAGFCRTPALTVGTSRAVVRFSSFGGEDWAWETDIRGMACRLFADERPQHPDRHDDTSGRSLDLVAMTAPRFIVRRVADFIEAPRDTQKLRWVGWAILRRTTFTALWTLIRFRGLVKPLARRTRHLLSERYFGIHTFWLEKADRRRAMRYHWRPVTPREPGINDHVDGLRQQIWDPENPVGFDLIVDLRDAGGPYRKLHDPLRRWPGWPRELRFIRSRRRWMGTTRVVAGHLELTGAPLDPDHPASEQWVFNPFPAIGGFEASDDEVLHARGSAYIASHVERSS